MKSMLFALSAALVLSAGATGALAAPTSEPSYTPVVSVGITRDGERWTAEFTFERDAPVWAFIRSALTREGTQPWRPLSWTIETPGVELTRIGHYDALVGTAGNVPRKVRVRFKPYANDLRADYDPALAFTDGSVALFTEHYNAIPFPSRAAVEALPSHLDGLDIKDGGAAEVTFTNRSGNVLHGGKRARSLTLTEANSYVLFGAAQTVVAPSITTIMDPQLPSWLTAELASYAPRILRFYGEKLGPHGGAKPMIMASWAGPTPGRRSMGGSVLPGLIIMRFEGEVMSKQSKPVQDSARWFIAHESVHFWAGQAVRYGSPSEAWTMEGGADLLAIRAAASIDPTFDSRSELQRRLDECVELAAKGPIETANDRSEHNAYYYCGAMFGLAAEAAANKSGGDFFTFWRGLIEANRADGVVSRREWLTELSRLAGTNEAARIIAEMLDKPTPDAAAQLEELFRLTGVAAHRNASGALILS